MSKPIDAKVESTDSKGALFLREVFSGTPMRIVLSALLGFLLGALFIGIFSTKVVATYPTFGEDPWRTISVALKSIGEGYGGLLRGAIFNPNGQDFVSMMRPLTETLRFGAPLIMAGLGIALGFRVGLFNIGGTGQMAIGLIGATWVSTRMSLPWGLHLLLAIAVTVLLAATWGGLAGYLKAKTGAHEVIVTIMLNYIGFGLFTWFLREPTLLLEAGGAGNPKSDAPAVTAQLPSLFGSGLLIHAGVFLAVIAVVGYWWLMERSTIGYRFRLVGHNSTAARAAGLNVEKTYFWAMATSAALLGLAAANQGLGETAGLSPGIHANIGFDAITVALLGGSRTSGVIYAGLLLGAFRAGGATMQSAGVSPYVLGIIQALIVLFVAAPPIIKAIFRLPAKELK